MKRIAILFFLSAVIALTACKVGTEPDTNVSKPASSNPSNKPNTPTPTIPDITIVIGGTEYTGKENTELELTEDMIPEIPETMKPDDNKVTCEFLEWNTKEDYSGTKYHTGDKVKYTEDLVLYAHWGQFKWYSITTSSSTEYTEVRTSKLSYYPDDGIVKPGVRVLQYKKSYTAKNGTKLEKTTEDSTEEFYLMSKKVNERKLSYNNVYVYNYEYYLAEKLKDGSYIYGELAYDQITTINNSTANPSTQNITNIYVQIK